MSQNDKLSQKAREAAQNSYSPYSKFRVGAALETSSGKIYTGCNVENSSYGLTCCAERNALAAAIVAGERLFKKIAIYVDHDEKLFAPCGACRQVLSEFSPNLQVEFFNNISSRAVNLSELFPNAFKLDPTGDCSSQ